MRAMLPTASHPCQVGTLDTEKLRIRYAVPALISSARSACRRASDGHPDHRRNIGLLTRRAALRFQRLFELPMQYWIAARCG